MSKISGVYIRRTISVRSWGKFGWVTVEVKGLSDDQVQEITERIKHDLTDDKGVGKDYQVEEGVSS